LTTGQPDADLVALGNLEWRDSANPTSLSASITATLSGSTANNRGTFLGFTTKPDGGSAAERMRIDNAGFVGIGTAVPGALLQVGASGQPWVPATGVVSQRVWGADSVSGQMTILSNNAQGLNIGGTLGFGGNFSTTGSADFASVSGKKENATDANSAGFFAVATRPNAGALTERFRVASDGGMTVGSPTGGTKGAGTINAVTVYGNNVVLTSDRSLKTDIEPLPSCLGLVGAIEPKSFRWKPLAEPAPAEGLDGEMVTPLVAPVDFLDKINRGFIAQEVSKVLGGDDETVDLGGLVAVLWQAVREMSDKITVLEARRR
jgi:hypothetical protein